MARLYERAKHFAVLCKQILLWGAVLCRILVPFIWRVSARTAVINCRTECFEGIRKNEFRWCPWAKRCIQIVFASFRAGGDLLLLSHYMNHTTSLFVCILWSCWGQARDYTRDAAVNNKQNLYNVLFWEVMGICSHPWTIWNDRHYTP